jgi:signal transduction histidine kinase/DNA-binding CsgD family transcriptional regulator
MTDAATFDGLSALELSAELSCCRFDETAWTLHRGLRDHCPHEAIAITAEGSDAPLSLWTSPTFEVPPGLDWSSPTVASDVGRPVVAARGDAGSSSAAIVVVLADDAAVSCSQLEPVMLGLARVLAARIGGPASDADPAQLSLAHAVAGERDRITQELGDHFAQDLHTIINHLRGGAHGYSRARVDDATSVASRALVELRQHRRPVWRQARRVDDAFGALHGDLGELSRGASIHVTCRLTGRTAQSLPESVIDAACSITRAAMLNVVEHSGAARARVEWRVEADELTICIADDGSGFDPQRAAGDGLAAMRHRAEVLDGSLDVASTPGWGTRIQARLRLHVDKAVHADASASALLDTLGERELDVLRYVAVGHRNREIASELFLSEHTVKFHVGNIFEKLAVRTRAEAAAVAFAAGIRPEAAPLAAAA